MNVGRFKAFHLSDGSFRLDGGAMFGVVPKTIWCPQEPADKKNRIALDLGCLLIQTPGGKNILVDTGLSSKFDKNKKFLDIYAISRKTTLKDQLRDRGLSPADIHLVVNTHLHFDHAGGNTEFDESGIAKPAFPKARYVVQKEEWEDAHRAHERNQASYMAENFAPIDESRQLELVSGEAEIEPGLKVFKTGGHCRGHQCVMIESEGQTAVFLGDLVPTRSHVPLPYIMGYDLYPLDTLESKRALFSKAADGGWTLFFQHDAHKRQAQVEKINGRFVLKAERKA